MDGPTDTDPHESTNHAAAIDDSVAAILEAMPDGVLLFDPDGRLSGANSRFRRMWPASERGFEPGTDLKRVLEVVARYACARPNGAAPADLAAAAIGRPDGSVTAVELDVAGRSMSWRASRTASGGTMMTFGAIDQAVEAGRAPIEGVEGLLHAVAGQLPGLVALIGVDGRYRYASPAYSDWYGVPVERIVGGTDDELAASIEPWRSDRRSRRRRRDNIASALSGRTVRFEDVRRFPDGRDRHVRGALIPSFDDGGHVRGVSIVTIDISEQRRREQVYVESEDRYRSLVDLSPSSIMVHRDGECLFANRAAYEMYGLATGETMIGRQVLDLVHPDSRAAFVDRYQALLRGEGSSDRAEIKCRRVDGTEFHVENRITGIQWDGSPAVLVVGSDVSDRKRAERRIRDREAMFRGLVDASFDAVIISDHGKIVDFNAKALELYGYDKTEMTGLDVTSLMADDEREFVTRQINMEVSEPYDSVSRAGDGRSFPVELSARTFPWGDGRVRVCAVRDLTERHQAEEALRKSEELLRLVVDNVPALIGYVGADGRYKLANSGYEAMYGMPRDRIIGRHFDEFTNGPADETIAAEWRQTRRENIARALSGHLIEFEGERFFADGQPRFLKGSMVPHLGSDGEVLGICLLIQDVSERKRAEDALRRSEAELATTQARLIDAIESLPLGFNLFDAEERLVMSNGSMHELFAAYSHLLVAGTTFEEIMRFAAARLPDDVDKESWIKQRLDMFRDPGGAEAEIITEGIWNHVSYRKTSEGGTVSIRYDISARKRAEEALRESEERYRSLAELLPDAVRVITADEVVFANAAAADLLGAESPEQLLGLPAKHFIDPDDRDEIIDRAAMVDLGNSVPWREFTLKGFGGETLTVESALAPIVWEGRPSRLLVSRDTSRHKLIENQLRQAMEDAKQANVAKSRFLAAASHDLRQPIQALSLLNAALAYEVQDPSLKELIANIGHAVDAMRSVLDALLDISKLEAGVVTPRIGVFPIAALIERVAGELSFEAQAKSLDLRVVRSSANVLGDRDLLQRIIQNFVSNAIRYTNSGRVLIGCREHGADLHVQVWDTGPGIGEDQRERIFEEFYQLANPERDRSKGLGLGLAIVDRLARLLGHPIEVRSELGRGSMFSVAVPIADGPAEVEDELDPPPMIELDGKRILVLDDDPDVVQATKSLLARWGADVVGAHAADEALRLATMADRRPDLVIVDYVLPDGETGTDVIRRLDDALGAPVPSIVISGDVSARIHSEVRRANSVLLHKPVHPAKLRSLIHHLLVSAGGP